MIVLCSSIVGMSCGGNADDEGKPCVKKAMLTMVTVLLRKAVRTMVTVLGTESCADDGNGVYPLLCGRW